MTGADGASGTLGARPVVDARGLHCPLPVIRLAGVARAAAASTEVTVLWTDPAARYDIPAWARMRGHRFVATVPFIGEDDGSAGSSPLPAYATTIQLRP